MDVLWLNLNMREACLQYASLQAFFFLVSKTFINWNWQKIKQMLSNTLRLNFWHPKTIGILHPRYHPTITGHILKNKQKNKHVCIHEIMQLIIMKMKTKTKIDSHKYSINRPRCRHGHKYSKYMKRLGMVILICIKQHLSNIWSSVYKNVKQHWCWVEKSVAYRKYVKPGNDAQQCWSGIYVWSILYAIPKNQKYMLREK